jgi:tetratricopeptide (TPR) repeat protein
MNWRLSRSWIAILLWLSTVAVYLPTVGYGFVPWDDQEYVTGNPGLAVGLTAHAIARSLTTPDYANWTPLTMLSYAVDYRLYGQWAGGYHLTNLLLNAFATSLLFFALARMTGALGPSAFVAAVFGVHPLHVESVAWVSERKDVLSGVFFMATLWTYARYTARPTAGRYAAVAGSLALGLLSKPMLVTTPFVLLLLDVWPLYRIDPGDLRRARGAALRCLLEKLPLLGLAGASAWVTYHVQSVTPLAEIPLAARLMNLSLIYVWYLEKTFWPRGLVFFYPLVAGPLSPLNAGLAFMALLTVTLLVLALLRRAPYLATGWFWYLGMLIPVVGLVQVGDQAYADRYAYLPQIGVVLGVTWGVHALARWARADGRGLAVLAGTTLAALVALTSLQIPVWRDGVGLGEHALSAAPPTATAHFILAAGLLEHGRYPEARQHALVAIGLSPENYGSRFILGELMALEGKQNEAIVQYSLALHLKASPEVRAYLSRVIAADLAALSSGIKTENLPSIQANAGLELTQAGQLEAGEGHLRRAIERAPDVSEIRDGLADNLQRQGRDRDAIAEWRESLRLNPDRLNAMTSLAWLLATADDPASRSPSEAIALAERAAQLTDGKNASVLNCLAAAYAAGGQRDEAARIARRGLELAQRGGDAALANEMSERLARYEDKAASSQ